MAKVNMTDVWLRSLRPPTGARAEYRDARVTGLVLRVTPRGVMSWSVIYKPRSARTKRRRSAQIKCIRQAVGQQ